MIDAKSKKGQCYAVRWYVITSLDFSNDREEFRGMGIEHSLPSRNAHSFAPCPLRHDLHISCRMSRGSSTGFDRSTPPPRPRRVVPLRSADGARGSFLVGSRPKAHAPIARKLPRRHITVFSPEGRLYQVGPCPRRLGLPPPSPLLARRGLGLGAYSLLRSPEYAFKAAKVPGLTAIGTVNVSCSGRHRQSSA